MQKYIEDKNGRKYTAKQMRLRVVRELIFVLKNSDRLKVVMHNGYLVPIKRTATINFESANNAKKELEPLLKHCEACALGGLFLADLIIRDKYKVGDVDAGERDDFSKWRIKERLSPYFTDGQLELIELSFEANCRCYEYGHSTHKDSNRRCLRNFARGIENKDRLLAILQNIRKNDGIFRPFAARR